MKLFEVFGEIALKGQEAVNRALEEADKQAERVSKTLGEVGANVSGLGESMSKWVTGPIAAVTTALGGLALKAVDVGSNLVDSAKRAGLTVEAYQELGFAIGQITGASAGEIDVAFKRINQRIGLAAQGNKNYIESLQAMGFSLAQIQSGTLTSEQVFEALRRQIQGSATDAQASAYAAELLGDRIGQSLGPALRAGGAEVDNLRQKFRDMGMGMSSEAANAAEGLGDEIEVLQKQFEGVTLSLGSAFIPILTQLVSFAQTSVVPVFAGFASVLSGIGTAFSALPEPVQAFIGGVLGIAAALGPVLLIVGKMITMFAEVRAAIIALTAAQSIAAAATGTLTGVMGALSAAVLPIAAIIGATVAAIYLVTTAIENWDAITQIATETFNTLAEVVKTAITAVWGVLKTFAETVVNFYIELWKSIITGAISFGQSLVSTISGGLNAAWETIKGWGANVLSFFQMLPQQVLNYVTGMVTGVVNRVRAMVADTIAAIKAMYIEVVGNSIVPDMVNEVNAEMARMADTGAKEAQRFNRSVQNELEGVMPSSIGPTTRNRGVDKATGSNTTIVDMRHAVIRDDRDMIDRLNRNGQFLAGAF